MPNPDRIWAQGSRRYVFFGPNVCSGVRINRGLPEAADVIRTSSHGLGNLTNEVAHAFGYVVSPSAFLRARSISGYVRRYIGGSWSQSRSSRSSGVSGIPQVRSTSQVGYVVPATAASKIHTRLEVCLVTQMGRIGLTLGHQRWSSFVLTRRWKERGGFSPPQCPKRESLVSSFLGALTSEFLALHEADGHLQTGHHEPMPARQALVLLQKPPCSSLEREGGGIEISEEDRTIFFSFRRGKSPKMVLRSSISTAPRRRNSQTSPKDCRADVERKPIKFQLFRLCHHHVPPGSGRRFRW
jgi:hypothetical protein